MKRLVALILALSVALSLVCVSAFAADPYTYEIKADGTAVIKTFRDMYATDFTVPSEIEGHPVTEIANEAFKWKKSLQSITFPESLTLLGKRVFSECTNLRTVSFTGTAVSIGENCFDRCEKLEAFSANVSSLGEYVFANCTSLASVNFGNTLTEIPEFTFYKCSALKTVVFPSALTRICRSAFNACTSLETMTFPSTTPFTIEKYAFLDCKALAAVTLTPNIAVEDYAFAQRADNVYVHNISITCQKYSNAYLYCSRNGVEPVFAVYTSPGMMGDIDADGAVTTTDARITLRIAAKLEKDFPDVSVFADLDEDTNITTTDARRILRIAARLEEWEPAE